VAARPLVVCGALRAEVARLVAERGWEVAPTYLDPALHVDLRALGAELSGALARSSGQRALVVYGDCHPRMDRLIAEHGAARTGGGNCLEMLLGPERYADELAAGTFFLLEPWARSFDAVVVRTFGGRWEATRAIFQEHCRSLLAIRTPTSLDYAADAERVAARLAMPLRWADADLGHLAEVLAREIAPG
jgi:hypothetical protein